jgi:hypothetical protein
VHTIVVYVLLRRIHFVNLVTQRIIVVTNATQCDKLTEKILTKILPYIFQRIFSANFSANFSIT